MIVSGNCHNPLLIPSMGGILKMVRKKGGNHLGFCIIIL